MADREIYKKTKRLKGLMRDYVDDKLQSVVNAASKYGLEDAASAGAAGVSAVAELATDIIPESDTDVALIAGGPLVGRVAKVGKNLRGMAKGVEAAEESFPKFKVALKNAEGKVIAAKEFDSVAASRKWAENQEAAYGGALAREMPAAKDLPESAFRNTKVPAHTGAPAAPSRVIDQRLTPADWERKRTLMNTEGW